MMAPLAALFPYRLYDGLFLMVTRSVMAKTPH